MVISISHSALVIAPRTVRSTVAPHAGTVVPIRCTNTPTSVSTVHTVNRHCNVTIVRSTTRTINACCGKQRVNTGNATVFSFRTVGGVAYTRNNLVMASGRGLTHRLQVLGFRNLNISTCSERA